MGRKKDTVENRLRSFIPNELGINLCSVESINVQRQKNGEIKEIKIVFIPAEPEEPKDFSKSVFA